MEPGLAYHVTQRGVDGVDVFRSQSDRRVYQDLAAKELDPARASVLAYCWMINHYWIVVPEMADSLAVLFRRRAHLLPGSISMRGGAADICGRIGFLVASRKAAIYGRANGRGIPKSETGTEPTARVSVS